MHVLQVGTGPGILKRVGEFSLGHAAMIAMLGSMWIGDLYSEN